MCGERCESRGGERGIKVRKRERERERDGRYRREGWEKEWFEGVW